MRHCRGDENLAKEYGQVYERVEELLLRLEGLLGEERQTGKIISRYWKLDLRKSGWA